MSRTRIPPKVLTDHDRLVAIARDVAATEPLATLATGDGIYCLYCQKLVEDAKDYVHRADCTYIRAWLLIDELDGRAS